MRDRVGPAAASPAAGPLDRVTASLEVPARPRHDAPRAPFAPTLALVVVLAVGAFAVVMPLIMLLHRPSPLPPPLPSLGLASQNQGAENLVYLFGYAVIVPLALALVPRVANAVCAAAGPRALSGLAGLLAATLAVAVLGVKLAGAIGLSDGVKGVLVLAALWWVLAAALLAGSLRPAARRPLELVARLAAPIWALAAVLVIGTLLCLTVLRSVDPVVAAVGAVAGAAVVAAQGRVRLPRLPRPAAAVVDAVLVLLILLAVPDLVVFPGATASPLAAAIQTSIIQFHQDFLLGPANELLSGGAMLVDTASQYGVGSIYLLAGWFHVAPIGYGTLGFLDGALTALWFVAGYAIVRLAGSPRTIAACALGAAVVALVFNLSYPVGALPQDGPLRFGLPMGLVLASVAGERWPAGRRWATAACLLVLAASSVWSLEAFAYTAAVYAAIACLRAWLRSSRRRLRWLLGQAALAVLACVCAHVLFALATLAATGQWPNWGQYLAYLRAFLFGDLGALTYDVARWAPGLAVGAAYAASAVAIVELARRRGALAARERPALVALTGLTAYGIVLLSYYVNRSLDHILMHVTLPAVLLGALWLSLLLRWRPGASAAARRGGLAFALAVAVLLVSVAWSAVGHGFPRSALAHAAPGGSSLGGALHRLWHPSPLSSSAPDGVRMLDRYMPGERRSLVVVTPDLGTEILLRSGRVDRLFLGDPWEASFVADERLPGVRRTVATLRPGTRMLLDARARTVLRVLRAHPSLDPLKALNPGSSDIVPHDLAPLQQWALQHIDARFALRTIHRDAQGFSVVELEPRASGG